MVVAKLSAVLEGSPHRLKRRRRGLDLSRKMLMPDESYKNVKLRARNGVDHRLSITSKMPSLRSVVLLALSAALAAPAAAQSTSGAGKTTRYWVIPA